MDIDDINEEGLLYNEDDRLKIVEKFRAAGVDGLLLAHCNFGTEYLCARLAKDLNVPGAALGTSGRASGARRHAPARHAVRPLRHRQGAQALSAYPLHT